MISPGKIYGISPGRSAKTGWRNDVFFAKVGDLDLTWLNQQDLKWNHQTGICIYIYIYSWVLVNIICDYIKDTKKTCIYHVQVWMVPEVANCNAQVSAQRNQMKMAKQRGGYATSLKTFFLDPKCKTVVGTMKSVCSTQLNGHDNCIIYIYIFD